MYFIVIPEGEDATKRTSYGTVTDAQWSGMLGLYSSMMVNLRFVFSQNL